LTPQQILEYTVRDDLSPEEIAMADIDKSGAVDMMDIIQAAQVQSGRRDPRNLQGINPWLQQYQMKSDMPDFSQYALKADMPTYTPFDPSNLQSQITALQGAQPPTPFDPSNLQSRLAALEGMQPPSPFDATGLQARLAALESQLGAAQSPAPFDPSGLQSRLAALEGKTYGGPSLTDIEALIEQQLANQFPSGSYASAPTDNPYAPDVTSPADTGAWGTNLGPSDRPWSQVRIKGGWG